MKKKYIWEKANDDVFFVKHIESNTPICLCSDAEKAHSITTAKNTMDAIGYLDIEEFVVAATEEREAFSKAAKESHWWMEIGAEGRVPIENILIMYDQMLQRLQSARDVISGVPAKSNDAGANDGK